MIREKHSKQNEAGRAATGANVKRRNRRYTPPRILFREGLEVVASTCSSGTAKSNPGSCPEGPIQS